jgi:transcription elongation factor GreA
MGDLAENAEYAAAREELSFVDGRIEELEEILKQVIIIADQASVSPNQVKLGSKVTVRHNGNKTIYHVVGEWEADPAELKISHESPLGKALLGKKIGESVEVAAPAGKVTYTIVSIK